MLVLLSPVPTHVSVAQTCCSVFDPASFRFQEASICIIPAMRRWNQINLANLSLSNGIPSSIHHQLSTPPELIPPSYTLKMDFRQVLFCRKSLFLFACITSSINRRTQSDRFCNFSPMNFDRLLQKNNFSTIFPSEKALRQWVLVYNNK